MSRDRPASLTDRAAYATWWSALEIAARYGMQFLIMVLLGRLLAPGDFGMIAMLLVFTTVAALLVDSGFGSALVQQQRINADDETTAFLTGISVSAMAGLALWLCAPAIAAFYDQPRLQPLMRLLVFVLPLAALAAVPDALLTKRLAFRARTRAEVVASLCSGGVAVALAWLGHGVDSLVWQSLVSIGVRAAIVWQAAHWRPRGHFRAESFRRMFAFGGYMLLTNLLNAIHLRLQSLLIGKLFDSRSLGYYTMAQNTQQAPAQFMSGVLNRVGLPVFATVADQPTKLLGALRMSLRVALFLFVPCMVGIAVVAEPIITLLYGTRWAPAAPLLAILALAAALWPLHVLNIAAINALGHSKLVFRLELVKRTVSIGLVVTCSAGGPLAIAWAVLVSSVLAVVINTWYSHRLLGYGALAQLRDQAGTALLSLLAAFVGWLVMRATQGWGGALPTAITAAGVVYVSLAALTRQPALAELWEIACSLRSGRGVPRDPSGRATA